MPVKTDSKYDVVVKDQYPVTLTRMKGGKKGPVLLVHGVAVSSAMFTLPTVRQNFAEFLRDHGYDVLAARLARKHHPPAAPVHAGPGRPPRPAGRGAQGAGGHQGQEGTGGRSLRRLQRGVHGHEPGPAAGCQLPGRIPGGAPHQRPARQRAQVQGPPGRPARAAGGQVPVAVRRRRPASAPVRVRADDRCLPPRMLEHLLPPADLYLRAPLPSSPLEPGHPRRTAVAVRQVQHRGAAALQPAGPGPGTRRCSTTAARAT